MDRADNRHFDWLQTESAGAENRQNVSGSGDDASDAEREDPAQGALEALLTCSGGSAVVASASTDGMLRLWDLRSIGDQRCTYIIMMPV